MSYSKFLFQPLTNPLLLISLGIIADVIASQTLSDALQYALFIVVVLLSSCFCWLTKASVEAEKGLFRMTTLPLDQALALGLQVIVTLLSNIYRSKKLSPTRNLVIALVAFVLYAIFTAYLTAGFTRDIHSNIVLIVVIFFTFLSEFWGVLQTLLGMQSPLEPPSPPAPSQPPVVPSRGSINGD